MRPDQLLILDLTALLLAAALAGVLVRGRHRLCWAFVAYLAATLVFNRGVAWMPDVFFTRQVWAGKKVLYDVLRAAVALEVAALTFWVAPRAVRRRAALVLAAMAALLVATNLGAILSAAPYAARLGRWAPRNETACLWLFAAVVILAARHQLPIHPFHRAVFLGFGTFLTFDVLTLGLVGARGRAAYPFIVAVLGPVAFAATAGVWAAAAWRRPREASEIPEAVRRLQPWASSW